MAATAAVSSWARRAQAATEATADPRAPRATVFSNDTVTLDEANQGIPQKGLPNSSWATASATGGNGGAGGSADGAGGNGGTASLGLLRGLSTGSAIFYIEGDLYGGSGGHGFGSGGGGNGATESLNNSVGAITGGIAYLTQRAVGGNSGGSTGGNPGLAGAGNATLSYNQSGVGSAFLIVTDSFATGGNGGACISTMGSNGGNANAYTDLTYTTTALEGYSSAQGGNGSDLTGGTGAAGAGGTGNATAHIYNPAVTTLNLYNIPTGQAQGDSYGGNGGSVTGNATGNAGAGGDSHSDASINVVDANCGYIFFGQGPNIWANSYGGAGGNVTSSGGGNAGAGGNATANVSGIATRISVTRGLGAGSGPYYALYANIVGNGGNGGSVTGTGAGNGGAGGSSTATQGTLTIGSDTIRDDMLIQAGNGGTGNGAAFSGGNGGAAVVVPFAVATPYLLEETVRALSGNGGAGTGGAAGGNGADVTLNNTCTDVWSPSAAITSLSTLSQVAIAGSGGGTDGGTPGNSGNATSTINQTIDGPVQLSIDVEAHGGSPSPFSTVQNTNGKPGGNGVASLTLSADHMISASVTATAGAGPFDRRRVDWNDCRRRRQRDGECQRHRHRRRVGQSHDSGYDVWRRQREFFHGRKRRQLRSRQYLRHRDRHRNGDRLSPPRPAGQVARRGFGYHSGNGGNASSAANATSSASPANATATANAGIRRRESSIAPLWVLQAPPTQPRMPPPTRWPSPMPALRGASGSASTSARGNSSGLISFVRAAGTTPVETSAASQSQAFIQLAGPTLSSTTGMSSAAIAIGTPTASDVTSRWAPYGNVKNAFASDPTRIAAVLLDNMQYQASGSGAAHTYSTSLEVNENNALVSTSDILLGTIGAQLENSGLGSGDSLHFRILRNSTPVVDQTFLTNTDAFNYFQNNVVDLGAGNANLNGANLDVQLLFDLTTSHVGAGLGFQFVLGTNPIVVQSGTWNNSAGGAWSTAGNWTGNIVPGGAGAQATFGSIITAPRTVNVDGSYTLGAMVFDNANSYTLSGTGITIATASGPGSITVNTGTHTISAALTLSADTTFTSAANTGIAITGNLTAAGRAITKAGLGTVQFNNVRASSLNVTAGSVQIRSRANSGAFSRVDSLSVANGSIAINGTLDLADDDVIVNATPVATVASDIVVGFNSGSWNGKGITSSAAQSLAGSAHKTALGYATASNVGITTFDGQSVTGANVLVRYTYSGDANLDGVVNALDFDALATNFGAASGKVWYQGDFNYDGFTNTQDFMLLASNFNQVLPAPVLASLVPEPTSMWIVAGVGAMVLVRRRRSRLLRTAFSANM